MQPEQVTQQDMSQQLGRTETYLEVDPGNTELLARAIDLSLAVGEIERASRHLAAACERYPSDPFFNYRSGHLLVAQHRWAEAEAVYAGLYGAHRNASIAYSLANCQVNQGKYQQAFETMSAYHADPELAPEAATLLIRVLHHLKQFESAEKLIETHRQRLAGAPLFMAAASLLCLDAGKIAEATAMANASLEVGTRPVEALVVSATLALANTDTDVAIQRFEEVLAKKPDEGRSWSGLGMASLLKRDLSNASKQLEQAVTYMPKHIGTWHALGWCRVFAGDQQGAAQAFDTALGLDRNFGESHGGVAVAAALRGDRATAEAAIDKAVRLDPQGLSARYAQMVLNGQTADPERFRAIAHRLMASHQTLSGEDLSTVVKRLGGR